MQRAVTGVVRIIVITVRAAVLLATKITETGVAVAAAQVADAVARLAVMETVRETVAPFAATRIITIDNMR